MKKSEKSFGIRAALLIQMGSKYANVVFQLIITMVLARILTPEEFGIVAVVAVFSSFFCMVSDAGIAPAIVQYDDLDKGAYNSLFFFSIILGLALMGIFIILSYPIAWFYSNEELIPLCALSSISVFFSASNMVPNGILLKQKRFLAIGVRLLVSTLVGGAVAVVMAFSGCGAYSLVAYSAISVAIVFLWNKVASGIKLNNVHFMQPLRKVLKYSAFHLGFSTVNYFSRNLDNMLIGKAMGLTQLGYYDKAYKLSMYPITFLSGVIGSVLQPYLSKYQNEVHKIYDRWCQVVKAISMVAAPLSVVFFSASYEITILFYGDQWKESAVLLQMLSFSIYFQMINNPTGAIYQASNHTDYMFAHSLVATAMTVVALAIGLSSGSLMVTAFAIAVAYCCHTFSILYFLVHKSLKSSVLDYCRELLPEIAIALVCLGVCSLLTPLFSVNIILALVEKLVVIVVLTLLLYKMTGQIRYIKAIFR